MTLSPETREWLLGFARRTIDAELRNQPRPDPDPLPKGADALRGCFVTLHEASGRLRGCIGTFSESDELWQNVRTMGIAAATRDPRFTPMTHSELADCALEISALTPKRQASADEVSVGRHGINIRRGLRRGVLLPQVAVEHGWDRETFLNQTCVKAGLPPGAWRESGTEIELFEAEVFGEGEGERE